MNRFFLYLFAFLFALSPFSTDAQEELPKALLWKISGPGLETPSYLYGTIHMIHKKDYFLGNPVREAIAGSDRVVFEINMESMNDMSVMMGMMMNAFMANDTSLQDLLSAEEYQLVADHFEQMGLPIAFLQRLKPMFLSALASSDFSFSNGELSNESMVSYEMEIMRLAQSDEKPLDGLETIEFQMSMFDSIPYRAQARMLVESIRGEQGQGDSEVDTLVQLYKTQDLVGMEALFSADQSGIGPYEDLLLNKRNRNWIPIMEEMMSRESVLFAVGAGHLVGENGVIALLKERGFTLEPVFFSWPDN